MRRARAATFIVLISTATAAQAAVVDSSPSSLQVKHTASMAAAPEKVWQSFLQVDKWWSGEHTFSGSASNLRLEARPGGCFCETLPGGGGVLHLTVAFVAPNKHMTLKGGLGPFVNAAVDGAMTFDIAPSGPGSDVTLAYAVAGYFPAPGGLGAIAPTVDDVLGQQFARLKRFAETGSAEEARKAP
jgi:hypothetical protein